jgi:hypothetical protein
MTFFEAFPVGVSGVLETHARVDFYNYRHSTTHKTLPGYFTPYQSINEAGTHLLLDSWSYTWQTIYLSGRVFTQDYDFATLWLSGLMCLVKSIIDLSYGLANLVICDLDSAKRYGADSWTALTLFISAMLEPLNQLLKLVTRSLATGVDYVSNLCSPAAEAETASAAPTL